MKAALVLDDSVTVRTLVAATLRDAGYVVHEAGTIPEALEVLSTTPISIAISDLNLEEGATGLEFLNQAVGLSPGLKGILMSGSIMPGQKVRTRFPILSKPFDPSVLLDLIAGLADP